jgi:AcrR family transcriptional regulator
MANPNDPRVIRTKRMLSEALVHCVLAQGYDAVTIQNITDQAGLRRATFYLHYRDKHELLLAILEDMFAELIEQMNEKFVMDFSLEQEYQVQLTIFRHAAANADLYKSLVNAQASTVILRHVRDYMTRVIQAMATEEQGLSQFAVPLDIVGQYIASVSINMVLWWLEGGMIHTAEKMAYLCAKLVLAGMSDVLRQNDFDHEYQAFLARNA